MGFPGITRHERRAVADPAAGQVYVERRPGETTEAFEMRLAAAARERGASIPGAPTAGDAYAKGRRDQRVVDEDKIESRRVEARPRHRHGGGFMSLVGLMVVIIAALGVVWMGLAYREGSFAAGGAVVDRKLAEVTAPAKVAANQAVDRTGAAVQNAGQAIETQGERLRGAAK